MNTLFNLTHTGNEFANVRAPEINKTNNRKLEQKFIQYKLILTRFSNIIISFSNTFQRVYSTSNFMDFFVELLNIGATKYSSENGH